MEKDIILDPVNRPQEWDKLTGRKDGVVMTCRRGIDKEGVSRISKRLHRRCEPILEEVMRKRYHRTREFNRNTNIQKGRRK
jgi:hypothetical protein